MSDWTKKDAEPETEPEPKPAPSGWGSSGAGTKTWSAERRTDDPKRRAVLPPVASGVGDGKVFHFLFGLKVHAENDRRLFAAARAHVDDDVEGLRRVGFTVVLDEEATKPDFLSAVYGQGDGVAGLAPAGVFWLAHGHADGAIECSDGGIVRTGDLDPARVHPALALVVFAACYTGSHSPAWRRALGGGPLVVGWGRPVTIDRAVDFLTPDEATETDLDDLIRRYILEGAAVPVSREVRWSPLDPAAKAGRSSDLQKRLEGVVHMMRAGQRERDGAVELSVPLADGRFHQATVFVVDGNEPYCEGELLLGVECDVGELTHVVDVPMLLSGIESSRLARVTLVRGEREVPRIVTQGFVPLARVRDMDVAALIHQVCAYADTLEHRIFGGDAR